MSVSQAVILGVLQGATEFLPISSSGHLVLVPSWLGWRPPGLSFDTLVHWGTAVAVLAYFWREWVALGRAGWRALRRRSLDDPEARLLVLLILGTVPAAVVGSLLEEFFEGMFARPAAAAAFLLVTAAVLAWSEGRSRRTKGIEAMALRDALLVGCAQAAAIFPGLSRSGLTMAAGLAVGLRREPAAHFSFLLSAPIVLGAGLLQLIDLAGTGLLVAQLPTLAIGFVSALVSGLACIHFLLRYVRRRSFYPFAVYCAVVGVVGLTLAVVSP